MKPIINWEQLKTLNRPPMPPPPKEKDGENMWDRGAANYNRMASLEKKHTLNQINAIPVLPTDTVLDVGCGPGRITVPMGLRAKSVTSIDSSEKMLEFCKKNAANAGLTNVTTKFMDFRDVIPGQNLEKHDIALSSRSVGLGDIEKLSQCANRIAALIIWANAPSIPELLGKVFHGTTDSNRPPRPPMVRDRRVGYNVFYNIVYDHGYEPNVSIVEDGFTRDYASREEAYDDIINLGKVDEDKMDIFKSNVDQFLTENADGSFTFLLETRTAVIWWEVNPKQF